MRLPMSCCSVDWFKGSNKLYKKFDIKHVLVINLTKRQKFIHAVSDLWTLDWLFKLSLKNTLTTKTFWKVLSPIHHSIKGILFNIKPD